MPTSDFAIPPASQGFEWRATPSGPALICLALEAYAPHLFTTRAWPLGSADGSRLSAWADVAAALGVDVGHLERAHQVHGASVVVRRAGDPPRCEGSLPEADILLSNDPGIVVSIQTADCVPVLIADGRMGVAAAHAGWRGMAAGVPKVAVQALARAFGSRPADLVAAVGPSISGSCYEVGDEVREHFGKAGWPPHQLARWFATGPRPGHWYFDGWAAARDQLEASGVPAERIHVAGLCTASHPDLLCSYRRDGKAAGRIAAAIRASPRRP
jgi:polyphenol oxidase